MQESFTVQRRKADVQQRHTPDQSTEFINRVNRTKTLAIAMQKDEDGRYVVTSPDMPGLVTDGADENEAAMNAVEAIEAILASNGENVKDLRITLLRKSLA